MLPFLSKRKISSILMAKTKPEGSIEVEGPIDQMDPGLLSIGDDILSAIAGKDSERLMTALKAAIEMCEMGPEEVEQETL